MTITTLALILLFLQVGLLFATLYLRYLGNRDLFKTDRKLEPVRSRNRFFGAFSGFYDRLDRIPLLRRSGTANEFDLLKAMLLTVVPVFLLELLVHRPSALVALVAGNVLLLLINAVLLAHPSLKRGADKLGGRRK
ncbi:MAG: hypothetical protein JSS83_16950 [Cyanobacteria bacterium SZAS LIN-3]|nr:hypothetical protein [Cyanobacteria bacterium SZAS LIN-3]MBS2010860.1 hypothetical protein [Cyanobacteria bacterium SZAS TMP-1]